MSEINLDGWEIMQKQWGRRNNIGCNALVPCYGKWSVVPDGGQFAVVEPNGWEMPSLRFDFQIEAMRYVEKLINKAAPQPLSTSEQAGKMINTPSLSPQPPVEFIQELAMNCKVCGRQLIGNTKIIYCPNGCKQEQPPVEVKDLEKKTCSVCNWTNVGCLNLGEPNKEEKWVCHSCIKRKFNQVDFKMKDLEKVAEQLAESFHYYGDPKEYTDSTKKIILQALTESTAPLLLEIEGLKKQLAEFKK